MYGAILCIMVEPIVEGWFERLNNERKLLQMIKELTDSERDEMIAAESSVTP